MTDEQEISLVPAPGGWAEVTWHATSTAYVRFGLNPDRKTWHIAELRMLKPTSEAIRSLPLGRIEAAANATSGSLALAVFHTQKPPADLEAHFRKERARQKKTATAGRFILERPTGRRLDDGFYARVAHAYREAAGKGLNPRQTLARDTGSAPDTVARWIGEARRRGFLPPGQPGKVTAWETKQ
jgi:hypothetical protein